MPLSQRSYLDRVATVRSSLAAQGSALWNALPDYRDSNVARFVRVMVPKVRAGQYATARWTAAYLGGTVLDRQTLATIRPVDPEIEYRRPAVKVYTELSNGSDMTGAVTAGSRLLTALLLTDLQLALRAQSQTSLVQGGHRRYRRVLSGSENCDRCLAASGNLYHSRDLLPIHDGCDCTVEPESEAFTVDYSGIQLTSAREEQVAAGASYASLVAVHEHGELGPVIAWASDHFTGPSDFTPDLTP